MSDSEIRVIALFVAIPALLMQLALARALRKERHCQGCKCFPAKKGLGEIEPDVIILNILKERR